MIIYDIETKKAVISKGDEKVSGIEYVDSWNDHKGFGISVICAYDYAEKSYRIFFDDNKDEFVSLVNSRKYVVGFNNKMFDDKIVAACWGIEIPEDKSVDIRLVMQKKIGYFKVASLGDWCIGNIGANKTGDGKDAPMLFQQGKYGKLVDYVIQDVKLTRLLFEKIILNGALINPRDGKPVELQFDESIRDHFKARSI